jgi:hypothetical protein
VLSIDPITAVSLTNAIPRNDELAETPHSSSWSSALRGTGSFRLFDMISQTYQDIGSEPTLVMEKHKQKQSQNPLIPGASPIKQVPILLGPGWVRVWKGKPKGPEKRGAAGN